MPDAIRHPYFTVAEAGWLGLHTTGGFTSNQEA